MIPAMKRVTIASFGAGLLSILLIVSAIIVISNSVPNQYFYGATIAAVFLLAILLDIWKREHGWKNLVLLFILSYTLITLSLVIGYVYHWPFGLFRYTDMLGHQIAEIVPWTVPVFWLTFIAAALSLTRRNRQEKHIRFNLFSWAFDAAIIVTLLDIAMEPIVVQTGLKVFQPQYDMYGVPLQHFLGFFVITLLVNAVIISITHAHKQDESSVRTLTYSALFLIAFFIVLGFKLGLVIPSAVGVLVGLWMARKLYLINRRNT